MDVLFIDVSGNIGPAFVLTIIADLFTGIGSTIAYFIRRNSVLLTAFVTGIMVYISLDELLPMAHRYGYSHTVIIGIVLGMFVMALSLLVLRVFSIPIIYL